MSASGFFLARLRRRAAGDIARTGGRLLFKRSRGYRRKDGRRHRRPNAGLGLIAAVQVRECPQCQRRPFPLARPRLQGRRCAGWPLPASPGAPPAATGTPPTFGRTLCTAAGAVRAPHRSPSDLGRNDIDIRRNDSGSHRKPVDSRQIAVNSHLIALRRHRIDIDRRKIASRNRQIDAHSHRFAPRGWRVATRPPWTGLPPAVRPPGPSG